MGGSKKQTIGYKYYLGVHAAICYGPVDALTEIQVGGRTAWKTGDAKYTGPNGDVLTVYKPDLFGGKKKEGGVVGSVDVLGGGPSQTQNSYLASILGGGIPSFRGVLSLVFRGWTYAEGGSGGPFYWAAMNPYIKPIAVKVKRILSGWNTTVWYSAKAAIGNDMNPAHIIYQCITDPVWGMGYPTSAIDTTSFTAAADALYTEGFGLSIIWGQQSKIGDFINEVANHIGAVVYVSPTTGKFAIKLIRFDYTPAALEVFNESKVVAVESYQRAGFGEMINEVVVVYNDAATDKKSSVTVQNLAVVQAQGAIVSQKTSYSGITSAALAQRVALRDLVAVSTPLSKIRLKVNRNAWSLVPGDVFKLSWSKLGLTEVIYRVGAINTGTLADGTITVDAVEDVFGLPASSYTSQEPPGWIDPATPPSQITRFKVTEPNYYDVATTVDPATLATYSIDDSFIMGLAEKPSGSANTFDLYFSNDTVTANFVSIAEGEPFCPTAQLNGALSATATSIVLDTYNGIDISGMTGMYGYIDDEAVYITAVNIGTNTITVKRGIFDTLPSAHADNAVLWLYSGDAAAVPGDSVFSRGENTYYRLVARSVSEAASLASAPQSSVVVQRARWALPWPPANVQINGQSFPAQSSGAVTVTFVGRNRLQQTAGFTGWTEGHIDPEDGTTYTLQVYDDDTNSLLYTQAGIVSTETGGGTFWAGSTTGSVGRYRVELKAVRDGLDSMYSFSHAFNLIGYGLHWDESWSGDVAGSIIRAGDVNTTPYSAPLLLVNDGTQIVGWAAGVGGIGSGLYFFSTSDASTFGSMQMPSSFPVMDRTPYGWAFGGGRYITFSRNYGLLQGPGGNPYNRNQHYMSTATSIAGPWTFTQLAEDSIVTEGRQPIAIVYDGTSKFFVYFSDRTRMETTDGVTLTNLVALTGSFWTSNSVEENDKLVIKKLGAQYIAHFASLTTAHLIGSILRSTDGVAWVTAGVDVGTSGYTSIRIYDTISFGGNLYAAASGVKSGATYGLVLRSTDGGTNWSLVLESDTANATFTGLAASSSTIGAIGSGVIWTSSNGTSWTKRTVAATIAIPSENGINFTINNKAILKQKSGIFDYDFSLVSTPDFVSFTTLTRA